MKESLEPKKLALIRILQLLKNYSDENHVITHDQLTALLESEYGINIERKAIGRNISLLKEVGYKIETVKKGSYLTERMFEDSELRLLYHNMSFTNFEIGELHIKARLYVYCQMFFSTSCQIALDNISALSPVKAFAASVSPCNCQHIQAVIYPSGRFNISSCSAPVALARIFVTS